LAEKNGLEEVAVAFNELMQENQDFAENIAETTQKIGEEGKLDDRSSLKATEGAWKTSALALEKTIDNLIRPIQVGDLP
jgi:rubrerythrin